MGWNIQERVKNRRRRSTLAVVTAFVACGGINACYGDISFNGGIYSQNFDTLANAGGPDIVWANDSTISGWYLFHQPTPATAADTYRVGTGNVNNGSFYSFGATASAERALGGVASGAAYFGSPVPAAGTVAGWIAVALKNTTVATTFGGFVVNYDGEQWRNGGNTTAQTMAFEYGFGSDFNSVSSWTAPGGNFDWSSPVATATAAAVDGNVAGLVPDRGGTVNVPWNADQTLWLRGIERNDTGNDHGLAIDDFSVTAVPEPATWGIISALGLGTIFGLNFWRERRAV